MNKQLVAIIISLFFTLNCLSQSFSVSGTVKDESGLPLAFVNVYLSTVSENDQMIINGSTTEDNGSFSISDINQGNYILTASFIGYKTYEESIDLNSDLTIDIVLMTEAEALTEVEITVKRPTLRREADRLIFNVENTALSEGNVLDVLKSTPGVLVLDNAIAIRNQEPTVFINNRKVHLSTSELSDLLEGTSASNIQSVEVITNPSARYDAESGVVLNIVMSKNLITGYRGSIFSNYTQGVFPKLSHGITNYFKSSKVNFSINYTYNDRKIDRVNREEVNYLNNSNAIDETWTSNLDRNTWSETHLINSNVDFNFDENNVLSISSNLLFLPYFKYVINNNTEITADQPSGFSSFKSTNLSRDNKHNLGFDVNYSHTFRDTSQLLLNTHYTNYDYSRAQEVNSRYFLEGSGQVDQTAFNTMAKQNTDILTSQLDFLLPLKAEGQLEIGAKYSNVTTESSLEQNDIVNGQEEPNAANSDAFDYNEDVYAAYLNLSKSWEKFSLGGGIRVEQTKIEGNSASQNDISQQDYTEWFPSVNMSLQASERLRLYTSYRRSITRPEYSDLNPFKFFLNDNNLVTGNPNLLPVFADHVIVGSSFKNVFFAELYYKNSKNSIVEFPIQDNETNIISYTPINLISSEDIGVELTYVFNVTERWSATAYVWINKIIDQISLSDAFAKQELWSDFYYFSNNLTLLKDNSLSLNVTLYYVGRNLQGLQQVGNRLVSSIDLKKTMFKGRGVLSLSLADLFNEQDFTVRTRFLNQNSTLFTNLDNRYVRLGFRYKFGNTKLTTNERELLKEERERLEDN